MTDPSAEVPTGTPREPENAWTEPRLLKFWEAMSGLYGRRWKTEYGDVMPEVWRRELMSITPDEAVLGWQMCRDGDDAYPCTLPQFMYRVKYAIQRDRAAAPVYKAQLALPKKERAEQMKTAGEYLAEIRKKLGA